MGINSLDEFKNTLKNTLQNKKPFYDVKLNVAEPWQNCDLVLGKGYIMPEPPEVYYWPKLRNMVETIKNSDRPDIIAEFVEALSNHTITNEDWNKILQINDTNNQLTLRHLVLKALLNPLRIILKN